VDQDHERETQSHSASKNAVTNFKIDEQEPKARYGKRLFSSNRPPVIEGRDRYVAAFFVKFPPITTNLGAKN